MENETYCIMTKSDEVRTASGGCKRYAWSEEPITARQYNLTVGEDTIAWFKGIGGSERATRAYTNRGYLIVRLTSTSPDRKSRTVRCFNFK